MAPALRPGLFLRCETELSSEGSVFNAFHTMGTFREPGRTLTISPPKSVGIWRPKKVCCTCTLLREVDRLGRVLLKTTSLEVGFHCNPKE